MAYDSNLAKRIRQYFKGNKAITEKKMFGGLGYMMNGHLCVGVLDKRLMARVGPKLYPTALEDMHVTIMDFTGKPLTGFVYVEPEALTTDKALNKWIDLCEQFVSGLPPKLAASRN